MKGKALRDILRRGAAGQQPWWQRPTNAAAAKPAGNDDATAAAADAAAATADDATMLAAFAQSWIVYHLAAAAAQRHFKPASRRYATGLLRKVALDLHYFVLSACPRCAQHHLSYLREHPIEGAQDLERWVFDLHNDVNARTGKPLLAESEFEAVAQHYREALQCVGPKGVHAKLLSSALPVLRTRWCYRCAGAAP